MADYAVAIYIRRRDVNINKFRENMDSKRYETVDVFKVLKVLLNFRKCKIDLLPDEKLKMILCASKPQLIPRKGISEISFEG